MASKPSRGGRNKARNDRPKAMPGAAWCHHPPLHPGLTHSLCGLDRVWPRASQQGCSLQRPMKCGIVWVSQTQHLPGAWHPSGQPCSGTVHSGEDWGEKAHCSKSQSPRFQEERSREQEKPGHQWQLCSWHERARPSRALLLSHSEATGRPPTLCQFSAPPAGPGWGSQAP